MIVGLDPSAKKLAFAYRHGLEVNGEEFVLTKDRYSPDSAHAAYKTTYDFLNSLPMTEMNHLFIESPVVGRGGVKTTMVQAFVSGAVQAAARNRGWKVYLVHNSKWKSEVVGAGNASKGDVRQHVLIDHPWMEGVSQDLIDAVAILEYGEKVSS